MKQTRSSRTRKDSSSIRAGSLVSVMSSPHA